MFEANLNSNQKYLLSTKYATKRIVEFKPETKIEYPFPNLRQCVGTNRLWGAALGKALFDDIKQSVALKDLVDIALLSRSILVLEDHSDDEFLKNKQSLFLHDWIRRMEDELSVIYKKIGENIDDHLNLRSRSQAEVRRRSKGIIDSNLYHSSIEKCLIFFNPYRLKLAGNFDGWAYRMKFLELFFFACQLLDDFQDLAEDRQKKLNNNIFYEGTSPEECDKIEKERLYWLIPLLIQVKNNFCRNEIQEGVRNSYFFSFYLKSAMHFLLEMLSFDLKDNSCIQKHKIIEFENWSFSPLKANYGFAFPQNYEKFIRPEFMQTYSNGFRDITLV